MDSMACSNDSIASCKKKNFYFCAFSYHYPYIISPKLSHAKTSSLEYFVLQIFRVAIFQAETNVLKTVIVVSEVVQSSRPKGISNGHT